MQARYLFIRRYSPCRRGQARGPEGAIGERFGLLALGHKQMIAAQPLDSIATRAASVVQLEPSGVVTTLKRRARLSYRRQQCTGTVMRDLNLQPEYASDLARVEAQLRASELAKELVRNRVSRRIDWATESTPITVSAVCHTGRCRRATGNGWRRMADAAITGKSS